jgi:hypothetical protein
MSSAIPLTAISPHRTPLAERLFFGGMGLAMVLTAFLGFAHSYYLRPASASPLSPLLQLHGALMTGWMLLYMVQTALIAAHRVDVHRRLGIAGVVFAVVLIIVATWASFVVRGFTPKIVFSAGAIVMFVVYLTAGVVQRRNAQAHKRWMLLFTLSLLPPAIARMHLPFLPEGSVGPNLGGLVFLAPAFAYDLATRRKIHPALFWGGLFMILMVPLRAGVKSLLGG